MNLAVLTLLSRLADVSMRREAARMLAAELGGEDLTVFLRDAETEGLLPAPGFPQTLPHGRLWRQFLRECAPNRVVTRDLPRIAGSGEAPVTGYTGDDGTVLALIGRNAPTAEADCICRLLPLLGAALSGERLIQTAKGQAAVAQETAYQAKQLAASLDNVRRDLQKAYADMQEARTWLFTVLQSIGDAVIATDQQGKVTFMNSIAQELTGWSQEMAFGKPLEEVFVIVNEETHAPVEHPVARVLRENRVVGLANHTLLIARDGREIPIDDSAAPIRDTSGNILGVVLIFRDFSERRLAEERLIQNQRELESLNQHLQRAMTETHHRIKNNLQVIAALIDMHLVSGRDLVPATELQRMNQHIRGLASIHDLLTQQTREGRDADGISVKAALQELYPLLNQMMQGRRLEFDICDDNLPVRQVTALTVLANELVSNATKHGKGTVTLCLETDQTTGRLLVWDEGPGFPPGFDPEISRNTGIDLIESIGRWDLRGDVFYRNRPEGGACVEVCFPVQESAR